MQSTLPGTASRRFAFCASIAAAFALIVLPELQAQPHAGSQTASATLHIQVTVVPVALTSSVSPQTPVGSVAYNLPTISSSVSPGQVTIRPLPSKDLNAFTPSGNQTPAVVETTTFVVQ